MKKLLSTRDNTDYKGFGIFLKRKGLKNSYKLATLFIDKFILGTSKEWQSINCEDLKEKSILPNKTYYTFSNWRNEMIYKGVIICMATKEEMNEKLPNHKANLFKPGKLIENYISKIIIKNLPSKLGKISDRFDKVEMKVDKVEIKMEDFEDKLEKMMELVLKLCPPDTEERRKMLLSNFQNSEKCLKILRKEDEIN